MKLNRRCLMGPTSAEMFNGADICCVGDGHELTVRTRAKGLRCDVTLENFVSRRALAAYFALWSCPQHLGNIQLLASVSASPETKDLMLRTIVLEDMKREKDISLNYSRWI